MKHFLITWHESDGNDCTVYDSVVSADSEELALTVLALAVEADLDAGAGPDSYAPDCSEFGYDFLCSADCPEDCEGHGGIVLREVTEYPSRDAAIADRNSWHCHFDVEGR